MSQGFNRQVKEMVRTNQKKDPLILIRDPEIIIAFNDIKIALQTPSKSYTSTDPLEKRCNEKGNGHAIRSFSIFLASIRRQ